MAFKKGTHRERSFSERFSTESFAGESLSGESFREQERAVVQVGYPCYSAKIINYLLKVRHG